MSTWDIIDINWSIPAEKYGTLESDGRELEVSLFFNQCMTSLVLCNLHEPHFLHVFSSETETFFTGIMKIKQNYLHKAIPNKYYFSFSK